MSQEDFTPLCKETNEIFDEEDGLDHIMGHNLFTNRKPESPNKIDENTWIPDSGASCHMTNTLEGMTDLKYDCSKIKIGSGKTMVATKIETYEGIVVTKDKKDQNQT